MGTQSTDIFETTNVGIPYTVPSETWTIDPGITVASSGNTAVLSAQTGSTLINNGNIFSGLLGANGVYFQGPNGAITNNGNITGFSIGLRVDGANSTVVNHGLVQAYSNIGVLFGLTSGGDLTNDGEIFGHVRGIFFSLVTGAVSIHNSGLIHSDHFGVLLSAGGPLTVTIENAVGGKIEGSGDAAIQTSNDGNVSLNNFGMIVGIVRFNGQSANQVVNKGSIAGEVHLGGGNDNFNGTGGTSGAVFGETGDDTLKGGSKADVLVGGSGKDSLTGAKGADKFAFNDVLDSVLGANHDSILDFNHLKHDKIDLHNIDADTGTGLDQAFHFIGSKGFHGVAGELRYAGHRLQGDVDGNGTADFEIHANLAQLVKGDFIL